MNGPMKMYRTKQIVRHDLSVNLPKCMYEMKNIHATITRRNNGVVERSSDHISVPNKKLDIFDQNNQNIPEMAALEARQEQILQQLAELKKQMNNIKNHLKIDQNGPVVTATKPTTNYCPSATTTVELKNLPDIVVINVSPSHPPYSLEIVQKLLQNSLYLHVESYQHSSVSAVNDKASSLISNLINFIPQSLQVPKLNVKLIWKNVEADTELLVSHTPIILGEVNLLRYLARLTTSSYLNYDIQSEPYEIDTLLDLTYRIIRSKTKTERNNLLQYLNKSLNKSQWLAGRNEISIADIAAYSAIKQTVTSNEINVNLGKWLQRCEKI